MVHRVQWGDQDRQLIANKFSIELQTLQPQGEATFVVRDGFIRTLNNFVSRGGVERRSTGAIDVRKMKTEEIIEHSEAITIDGLLADGAAKNRGSGSTITGDDREDTMQTVTKETVVFNPVLSV
jgi:hypothetical protein